MNIRPNEIAERIAETMAMASELIEQAAKAADKHGRGATVTVRFAIKHDKDNADLLGVHAIAKITKPTAERTDSTTTSEEMVVHAWDLSEAQGQTRLA